MAWLRHSPGGGGGGGGGGVGRPPAGGRGGGVLLPETGQEDPEPPHHSSLSVTVLAQAPGQHQTHHCLIGKSNSRLGNWNVLT